MDLEYLRALEETRRTESLLPQEAICKERSFQHFTQQLEGRMEDDWDAVIGICGEEGVGKTGLGIGTGMHICKSNSYDTFLREHVVYSAQYQEFYDKFQAIQPGQTLQIDEAINIAYKRFWNNELQSKFNQYLTKAREQRKCIFFCMPYFSDFDPYFRKHRIKFWIEVVSRGRAVVFVRDKVAGIEDPWHMKENEWLFRRHCGVKNIADRTLDDVLRGYRHYINYMFEFTFDDISDAVRKRYKELKKSVAEEYDKRANDQQAIEHPRGRPGRPRKVDECI